MEEKENKQGTCGSKSWVKRTLEDLMSLWMILL